MSEQQPLECVCHGPGFCQQYQREVSQREYELCSCSCKEAHLCSPEQCQKRRQRWYDSAHGNRQPPSLVRKAVNLARDATTHILNGAIKVPEEIYRMRLDQCQACPLYKNNQCIHEHCGCSMAGQSKHRHALWWASKECPDTPPRWRQWEANSASSTSER